MNQTPHMYLRRAMGMHVMVCVGTPSTRASSSWGFKRNLGRCGCSCPLGFVALLCLDSNPCFPATTGSSSEQGCMGIPKTVWVVGGESDYPPPPTRHSCTSGGTDFGQYFPCMGCGGWGVDSPTQPSHTARGFPARGSCTLGG